MKLKQPKYPITNEEYNKWLNSLPHRVFTYWFCTSLSQSYGAWVFEIEKEYPEYFGE